MTEFTLSEARFLRNLVEAHYQTMLASAETVGRDAAGMYPMRKAHDYMVPLRVKMARLVSEAIDEMLGAGIGGSDE